MVDESTYIFKEFNNGLYIDYAENLISVPFTSLENFTDLTDQYSFPYSISQIPDEILKFLDELLILYKFKEFKEEFTSLLVFIQEMYLTYKEVQSDDLIPQFVEEDKEYQNLLKIIEIYLFKKEIEPHSIAFKFSETVTEISTIKNSTVIDDIFKAICKNLGIDQNNFHEKKAKIIENSQILKPGKGGEYVKELSVSILYNFLRAKSNNNSKNELLRFCGCFLHLCQIPYNDSDNEFFITTISYELTCIDTQYLRHIIMRPKNLFTKYQ
ncbi:hypothetical protein [Chryseobacterium fistulae]|uniref:Uncharacterized protein n=1 Tax=Chryseobacterium fistulae TaxID=2675058 RepID=A0A6N4XM60_9FLAO|nr:hypothetical protein [Chryseobacterium fistulae]CAA7386968.1 hypothetical protein CHRY9393_01269 [Chryseobacterium fistulae]